MKVPFKGPKRDHFLSNKRPKRDQFFSKKGPNDYTEKNTERLIDQDLRMMLFFASQFSLSLQFLVVRKHIQGYC